MGHPLPLPLLWLTSSYHQLVELGSSAN
ncbi:hypothetical protein CIB84_007411 [Bambusicola thoracicus]|uniref:Uncharacterized protein n=1 Tax=Bambusicola thoracicus TaxID=9083 RepID=A0A2P4SXN1_BAMTH|nr:hypothetical protein CIB84_007411 [Bambusicola thoracicus]